MDTENSLQGRTGQVAPTAQNPQIAPLQNFTQSGDQLQTSNQSLYSGAYNGSQIIVPKETGKISSDTSVQPVVNTIDQGNSNTIVILSVGLIIVGLLAIMVMKIIKPQSDSQD